MSYYVLLLYAFVEPFNYVFHRIVFWGTALNVLWALIFIAFSIITFYNRRTVSLGFYEFTIVLLFVLYVSIIYVVYSGNTPGDGIFSIETDAFRALIEPIPIFFLLVVRGIKRNELNGILSVMVFMLPLSILAEFRYYQLYSTDDLALMAGFGRGISYNNYVPYVTFFVFAAIYLIHEVNRKFYKILLAFQCIFIVLFVFVNPSRQSVLFLFAGIMIYLVVNRRFWNLVSFTGISSIIYFSIVKLDLVDIVATRFFSAQSLETTRSERFMDGINAMGGLWDIAFGQGLSVVLGEPVNPHNNYIFSVITIGLFGTSLLFFPFFLAFVKSILICIRYYKLPWFDRNFTAFVIVSIFFVLFHSFFGYPHSDVLNGPVVWLALAIWVNYQRELLAKKSTKEEKAQIESVLRQS